MLRFHAYADKRLQSLQCEAILRGDDLWMDFTTRFSERDFAYLSPQTCQDLREILTARGVYLRKARGLQIYTSLLSRAKQAIYVPCSNETSA
jgi:hypothetical protein